MEQQLESGILSPVMDNEYQNYNAKSSNIHSVNYILTMNDDLYRQVVHEMSVQELIEETVKEAEETVCERLRLLVSTGAPPNQL